MRWWRRTVETRSVSRDDPNGNDPATVPPATVGPEVYVPGDPNGVVVIQGEPAPQWPGPPPRSQPWSGWPAEWNTPNWWGRVQQLTDTAWTCLDSNASILAAMPPYLVGAAPSLSADWLNNPDPDLYTSWEEFARQLFWDYQGAGEAFVLATAYYASGYPARFHCVPPWMIEAEIAGDGRPLYSIGGLDVTPDLLHVRYSWQVGDAHGHGPMEIGAPRLVAADWLMRYGTDLARFGGIPHSVLTSPNNLNADQAWQLQQQWVESRMSTLGMPAVLSGGITYQPLTLSPNDMALVELAQYNDSRIAVLLKVPPFVVGLPSGGDPMTYSNVESLFSYRWRAGLLTLARPVMAALSGWLLPRGTKVELNGDEFVRPGPKERAETWAILNKIVDPRTGEPVLSVEEIRQLERYSVAAPSETLTSGVLQ